MEKLKHPEAYQKNVRLMKFVEEIEDYAILTLDCDGNIENWNKGAERIKGYKAPEIIGRNFRIFYSQQDQLDGIPESLIIKAREVGKANHQGWRMRKDGTRFWGDVVITAIHDDSNAVIGYTKVTHDLTAKMLAEKAIKKYTNDLEIKNKELEQFVYIASHDLQEPLLTVQNFIELLEEEYATVFDDDAAMYFTYIKQASSRMRNLIKGLLDYSRIGRKKVLSDIDIEQLLKTVCQDLQTSIVTSGAQISFQNMPIIMGYEVELRQLFQNLISNAVKFRKKEIAPKINITATPFTDGWKFAIKDNGIGIAQQYKDKIFLIFQRLNNRDEYDGNGIGLANCKKIVEMHQGEISLESVPGEGSTFYFTIQI